MEGVLCSLVPPEASLDSASGGKCSALLLMSLGFRFCSRLSTVRAVSYGFVCVLLFYGESQPTSLVSVTPVFSTHNQGSGLCYFNTDL